MPEEVLILGAARTPVGRLNGALAAVPAPDLAATAIRGACESAGLRGPAGIAEVWLGCVLSSGLGPNPAARAARAAGLSPTHAACLRSGLSSGLGAVVLACGRTGPEGRLVVAGGMDSSSNSPFLLPDARRGSRLGHSRMLDPIGLDATGETGDPAWLEAVRALGPRPSPLASGGATGGDSLVVPVEIPSRKGRTSVSQDESRGPCAGEERIPGTGDGAAALVLAAGAAGRPLARVLAASFGTDLSPFRGGRVEAVAIAEDGRPGAPPGASGAICLVELIATLREMGGGKGLCVAGTGGADAAAVCIEVFPPK